MQFCWDQLKFSCIKVVPFHLKNDSEFPIQELCAFLRHIIMAIRAPRSFQATLWLPCLCILLLFVTFTCALQPGRPRLGVRRGYKNRAQNSHSQSLPATSTKNDYQTFYYDQPLDHFNYQPESYITFRQRYIVNFTHWGGAKKAAPIFVYLGGESTSDDDVGSTGFMIDNARRFGGLEVYAEVSINILLVINWVSLIFKVLCVYKLSLK